MPAGAPDPTPQAAEALAAIGAAVRRRRKDIGVSAMAAAEAAGISRPTLHRIEKGEPAVTMGAYLRVLVALGLDVMVKPREESAAPVVDTHRPGGSRPASASPTTLGSSNSRGKCTAPQELTPREALGIYERNARHLDPSTISMRMSRTSSTRLRTAFGSDPVV